jgi:hypothetical protein
MYKFGGYQSLYKARTAFYGERLSSLSSSSIGGYMAAGWHTVEVTSIALYKDSFDMKLINTFGDMHKQRIWPFERATGKLTYIIRYLLKFAELDADKITDLTGFHDLVGTKFRIQIRWQPFGYRIYSNGDGYYLVNGRGNKITDELFEEILTARKWATQQGLRPAYKEIARYASSVSIARNQILASKARSQKAKN